MSTAVLLACLACACGPTRSDRAPRASRPAGTTAPAPGPSPCTEPRTRDLATIDRAPEVVAVALGPEGGIVAFPSGAAEASVVPLDGDLAPRAMRRVRLPGATGLRVASTVAGGSVLVAITACPDGSPLPHCITAVAIDGAGEAFGAPVVVPRASPVARLRRASAGPKLLLAASGELGAPTLDAFVLEPTGLAHASVARLARGPADRQSDVLFATAQGDRWALLYRIGAVEDPTGEVVLATPAGEAVVEALHDAVMIDDLVLEPDGVAVLATFEFGRPLAFRVDARGALREDPAPVPPRGEPARPFEPRVTAHLERDARGTLFVPRTLAGDPIGDPIVLSGCPAGATVPSVARDDRRFVVTCVAPAGRAFVVRTATMECREPHPR